MTAPVLALELEATEARFLWAFCYPPQPAEEAGAQTTTWPDRSTVAAAAPKCPHSSRGPGAALPLGARSVPVEPHSVALYATDVGNLWTTATKMSCGTGQVVDNRVATCNVQRLS